MKQENNNKNTKWNGTKQRAKKNALTKNGKIKV